MDTNDRSTHEADESAGRLSDPPVVPAQGGRRSVASEFPEFAIERWPEWALVEQKFDRVGQVA